MAPIIHLVVHRVCPGQAFADASLWLAIAHLVAAFDIRKPLDEAGKEYTPPAAFKSGFTRLVSQHGGSMYNPSSIHEMLMMHAQSATAVQVQDCAPLGQDCSGHIPAEHLRAGFTRAMLGRQL